MITWSPETGQRVQAFKGPIQSGPPPPPPPPRPRGPRVNRVFDRLKWSVLDSPSKAEIFDVVEEDETRWTPLFTDPIAEEAALSPPQSRLQISIEPLNSWENWQQSDTDPPEQLLVENTDGQPISIKQFIQVVHDYAIPLRELLCQCCDVWGPEEKARARFYLSGFSSIEANTLENSYTKVGIHVVDDTDEDGHRLASRIETIEILYRKQTGLG
jgi:hypothetical protein